MAWSEAEGRAQVAARSGGLCEVHGGHDGAEWSHRKARSHGGDWAPMNGLWVCSPAHRWMHAHPVSALAGGWAVSSWDDPEQIEVWLKVPWPGWWRLGMLPDDTGVHVVFPCVTLMTPPLHLPAVAL